MKIVFCLLFALLAVNFSAEAASRRAVFARARRDLTCPSGLGGEERDQISSLHDKCTRCLDAGCSYTGGLTCLPSIVASVGSIFSVNSFKLADRDKLNLQPPQTTLQFCKMMLSRLNSKIRESTQMASVLTQARALVDRAAAAENGDAATVASFCRQFANSEENALADYIQETIKQVKDQLEARDKDKVKQFVEAISIPFPDPVDLVKKIAEFVTAQGTGADEAQLEGRKKTIALMAESRAARSRGPWELPLSKVNGVSTAKTLKCAATNDLSDLNAAAAKAAAVAVGKASPAPTASPAPAAKGAAGKGL